MATSEKTAAVLKLEGFLGCPTPDAWLAWAAANQDALLLDHANCEHKAAATALSLIHRYPDRAELVFRMARLAREELRHFEQVQRHIGARGIPYARVPASRYAASLRAQVSETEPQRLMDTLICGAFIEARSCERFGRLAAVVDPELGRFFAGLLAAEARHYRQYLELARRVADGADLSERIDSFRRVEAELILAPAKQFAFHSGVPSAGDAAVGRLSG